MEQNSTKLANWEAFCDVSEQSLALYETEIVAHVIFIIDLHTDQEGLFHFTKLKITMLVGFHHCLLLIDDICIVNYVEWSWNVEINAFVRWYLRTSFDITEFNWYRLVAVLPSLAICHRYAFYFSNVVEYLIIRWEVAVPLKTFVEGIHWAFSARITTSFLWSSLNSRVISNKSKHIIAILFEVGGDGHWYEEH